MEICKQKPKIFLDELVSKFHIGEINISQINSTNLGADDYNLRQLNSFWSHCIEHILKLINYRNKLIHLFVEK